MNGKLNLHFQLDEQNQIFDSCGIDVYVTSSNDTEDIEITKCLLAGICRDFSKIIHREEIWGEDI